MPVGVFGMKRIFLTILTIAGVIARADYVQDSADIARHVLKDKLKESSNLQAGSQNTINQGANTGQASQNAGSAANAAAGAALIASGMALLPNPPTAAQGAALIAMGMMALAQAGHDSGAAGASGRTAAASVLRNDTTTTSGTTQQPSGEADFYKQMKAAENALKANGYEMTDKGLKGPGGKLTPTSAFSSTSAMSAAGIDPKAIQELNKVNAAIADELAKYNVSGVPLAGGAGQAGMGEGGGSGVAAAEETGGVIDPFNLNANQKRNLLAGKTVNLDGDPIGVAGANIFEMVHDAYQKKRTGNQFIELDGLPEVRKPASIPKNK